MKKYSLYGVVALAFLIFGYISTTKNDSGTAGVYTVLGIAFAVMGYREKPKKQK